MATPFETLTMIEDAIAGSPRPPRHLFGRKPRVVALVVRAPEILGVRGRPWQGPDEDGVWFEYTVEQCRVIRRIILEAAREDAGL